MDFVWYWLFKIEWIIWCDFYYEEGQSCDYNQGWDGDE